MTQRAELQLSKAKLKAGTDKCNAELVKPAQEGSQKGTSGSRLTARRPRLPRQLVSRMS